MEEGIAGGGAGMTLDLVCASITPHHAQWDQCIGSWGIPVREQDGSIGMVAAYQGLYESSTSDVIAYAHDDLLNRDPEWQSRVLAEFSDPAVGLVCFGGGRAHGHPDLYKVPYQLQHLERYQYLSNSDDAELHGERFEDSCDVAVAEGFFLAVRRDVLRKAGGWPVSTIPFHCYDLWLSCMTHRLGYTIRMVGVRCLHLGGMTSVGLKADDGLNHAPAHRVIYDMFKSELPWRCA